MRLIRVSVNAPKGWTRVETVTVDLSLFHDSGEPRLKAARLAQRTLGRADERLGALIARAGPFRLKLSVLHDPYRALARAIIGQQISGKAAQAIFTRVETGLGGGDFPRPKVVLASSDAALRACGLSRMKALALRDLADKTLDGTVPSLSALHELEDAAIIERLTEVRGVGPWTVQMLLMFRLGRPDVMPSTDYGVRKGYGRIFSNGRLPSPKLIEKRSERWRPYRSVAAWYLWRALELPAL
jgi:DNA-3-methyladenine glycosylase II